MYHNHVLQGNALRFINKPLTPKDVGQYRTTLVQGTRKGAMTTIYVNENTEVSNLEESMEEGVPPFILNISGIDCDGVTQRWQLALSSADALAEWQEALFKAKEFVTLVEHSGEKELLLDIFRSMSQTLRHSPRVRGLKIYPSCFKGSQVVQYLTQKLEYTPSQAQNIASNMLNLRILEHVDNEHAFHGNNKHLYRFNRRVVATTNRGTNIFSSLLPVNKVGRDIRSESVITSDSGGNGVDGSNCGNVGGTELSPTTVHLLRLRRQTQAELKAAIQTIEQQQVQIDRLVGLHGRNIDRGDLLLTRTRRVEFLNVILQILLGVLCFIYFYGVPFRSPSVYQSAIPITLSILAVLCAVTFHLAPIYWTTTGIRVVGSTNDLLFEQITLESPAEAKSKVEGEAMLRKNSIGSEEEGEDDDDNDDDDEEEDDEDDDDDEVEEEGEEEVEDEDELLASGLLNPKDDEEMVKNNSHFRISDGFKKLLQRDIFKLRRIHSFLLKARNKPKPQINLPKQNRLTLFGLQRNVSMR